MNKNSHHKVANPSGWVSVAKQKKILQAVIFEYMETSRPVSSKQLVSKCGCSASSIRNYMAKLYRNGYLKGLHTSSGKIPTDKGWRYLISELLEIQRAILGEKKKLIKNYEEQIEKENSALAELSKTFFYILEHSEYNLSPKSEKTVYNEIVLRALDKKTVSGVIFSSAGAVKSFTVKTKEPVKQEFLDGIGELLNKILSGVTLSKIKSKFEEKTELLKLEYQKKLDFVKNHSGLFFNFESVEDDTASKINETVKKDIYEFQKEGNGNEREKK